MSVVKLSSSTPVALGKNILLQRFLDIEKTHIDLNHKQEKKEILKTAEQCASAAYSLLLEAEEHEKEKLDDQTRAHTRESLRPPGQERPHTCKSRSKAAAVIKIRPVTAGGPSTSTPRETDQENRRPSTAYPSLGKRVSIVEPNEDPQNTTEELGVELHDPEDVITYMNTPVLETVPRSPTFSRSHSFMEDRNAIIMKLKQKNTDKSDNKQRRNSQRQMSAVVELKTPRPTEPKPPVQSELDARIEAATRHPQVQAHNKRRPKTANDMRKKQPVDERTDYWNRRVYNLLNKWDMEDKPDDCRTQHNYTNVLFLDSKPPEKELPKHLQPPQTRAESNTRAFLQTYGSKFRSQLRPSSAPSTPSKHRRPVKVTIQELTSIKADFSRRRKDTVALLKKSKRLLGHIQGLVDASRNDRPY